MCGDPRALEERMLATVELHNACNALCGSGISESLHRTFDGVLSDTMPADIIALLGKLDMPRRS